MTNKNLLWFLMLIVVVLLCVSTVSAVNSNNTMDNTILEENSNAESISVCNDEQVDNMDESVLSAQEDNSNLTVNNDDEVLSLDFNEDSYLGVSSSETNRYLEDIKASTSDEYYKFVNYLIKEKGFKFKGKTSNDGYTVYSNIKYQSKLYDGSNYVLSAGTSYFLSKNRISYVLDELYPDVLYVSGNNYVLDELYLGWLKWTEKYHPSLNIGQTINTKTNNLKFITSSKSSSNAKSEVLPNFFDLRDVDNKNNYLTPVKHQRNASTCWAFASIAGLESFLLKNEGKSYEFSNKYDFSENNLKNVMSSLGKDGIYGRSPRGGGNFNTALAYLIRWSGPILEEYDKYDTVNDIPVNNIPLEFFNSEKHVQGVKYIRARSSESDNDEIKRAVMDYGGVVTSLLWDEQFQNENNYYCPFKELADPKSGHEVCIIGWNNSYNKTNFNVHPPGNGAFIVKNSWGNNDGDGYYYISYYDATLAKRVLPEFNDKYAGFSFTSVQDKNNFGKNYNYNPLGVSYWWTPTINNKTLSELTYYSQWVANSDDNLKACGVYVHDACECIINVKVDDNLKGTTTKKLDFAGFHTINLNNIIPVKKGQKFRMEVTIKSPQTAISIPFEVAWTALDSKNDKTYDNVYSHTDETGLVNGDGSLFDITELFKTCNICVNAYTEFKQLSNTKIEVSKMSISNYLIKDVTVKLSDSKNNVLKNFELSFCCGKDYKSIKTNNNGEASYVVQGNGDYLCIYYFGSESYNYAFTPLKINMAPPKTTCEATANIPKPNTVDSQTTINLSPNAGTAKLTSKGTVLKISGISDGKTYSTTAKLDLKLNKKVDLKIPIKIGSVTYKFKFEKGKHTLKLKSYNLNKNKSYNVKFSYEDSKYYLDESMKIKTK